MRHPRLTWQGAFHHVMNRGLDDNQIFFSKNLKEKYLQLIEEKSNRYKIRIFAHCIMDNHFHMVLENTSGKLSDFMKQLNSMFGAYYRTVAGGKGYVFHDRFKSTLIQDETYLLTSIIYTLLNPVRAGITKMFATYQWSSAQYYFAKTRHPFLDQTFVDDLFGDKKQLFSAVLNFIGKELEIRTTKFGDVLGSEGFLEKAESIYNRRKHYSIEEYKRIEDKEKSFEPVEKIYQEFRIEKNICFEEQDFSTHEGSKLRGELLVRLKDLSGMTYREIKELPEFCGINFSALGSLYKRTQLRLKEKCQNAKDRPR